MNPRDVEAAANGLSPSFQRTLWNKGDGIGMLVQGMSSSYLKLISASESTSVLVKPKNTSPLLK